MASQLRTLRIVIVGLSLIGSQAGLGTEPSRGGDRVDWPHWRGPFQNGASDSQRLPREWSENHNLRWKVELPGQGSSSPIVVGDQVLITSAEPQVQLTGVTERTPPSQTFWLLSYHRQTGKLLWRTGLASQVPHEPGHPTNTFASSSPVSDGISVYVSLGSRGVHALSLKGEMLWSRDLGKMTTRGQFGEGSSPAVGDGVLVVPFDHEGDSFVVALDSKTGTELWRRERNEPTTWATPLITPFGGRHQVILNGTRRVRSYDLKTGDLIWECGGQNTNPIPSPIRFQDDVIVMTGYRGYTIDSIPLAATGDITDRSFTTWSRDDAAPYVSSPLLCNGMVYFVKSLTGLCSVVDAKTGRVVLPPTRLPEIRTVYASPVAGADCVYLTGRGGVTVVIKPVSELTETERTETEPSATELKVLAVNRLDGTFDASPAIAGAAIFIRSRTALYCIAQP